MMFRRLLSFVRTFLWFGGGPSSQEIVWQQYPSADLRRSGRLYVIRAEDDDGTLILAAANSEDAAWADAEAFVRKPK